MPTHAKIKPVADLPEETLTLELLADWYNTTKRLGEIKSEEALLRKRVFRLAFPNAQEGTNRVPIDEDPEGYDLVGTQPVTRTVDEALLTTMEDKLTAEKINVDLLFPTKRSLAKAEYNKLTDEQRNLVDNVLDIKNGSAAIKIEQRKAKANN